MFLVFGCAPPYAARIVIAPEVQTLYPDIVTDARTAAEAWCRVDRLKCPEVVVIGENDSLPERPIYVLDVERVLNEAVDTAALTYSPEVIGRLGGPSGVGLIVLYTIHAETSCGGSPGALSKRLMRRALTHEIGHALGYDHVPDRGHVMFEQVLCAPWVTTPAPELQTHDARTR